MSNLLRKYAFPIKLVFSVALLGYCVYLIDLSALRGISVKWSWMGAALILIFIGHGIGAIRFKLLLDPVRSIRLINHTKYYVWAGFFNSTLPTSIGGDAMRIVWLKHHDVSLNKSSFFVLLERLIGVATLLAIACTTALFLELPNQLAEMMWAAIRLILKL